MKIGDAGEAFFVFETDEDVPEEIVTSPLLEATKVGQTNANPEVRGKFGAKEGNNDTSDAVVVGTLEQEQEPEFLDLNATRPASGPAPGGSDATDVPAQGPEPDTQDNCEESSLLAKTVELGKAAFSVMHEAEKDGKDKLRDTSLKDTLKDAEEEKRGYVVSALDNASHRLGMSGIGGDKGDEVLPPVDDERAKTPEVMYGHGKQ